MTGKTHIVLGAAAGIAVAVSAPVESTTTFVAAAMFSSLVPDLDHPSSKLNQWLLPINNKFFKVLTYLFIGIILINADIHLHFLPARLVGLACVVIAFSQHRSLTHSLIGLILFVGLVYIGTASYGLTEVWLGFAVGYVTHLLADFMTVGGLKLFYPYRKHFSFFFTVKTNGYFEKFLFVIVQMYITYIIVQALANSVFKANVLQ